MNNFSKNRYFILIKKEKILFKAIDIDNKNILTKNISSINNSSNDIFNLAENFLSNNIFEIEKNLKNFIKEIYIIFESDLFFEVTTSFKFSLDKTNNNHSYITDSLIEIRNQFKKYSPKDKIIHMAINQFTLGDRNYFTLPENIISNELIVQVNFICLKEKIINDLKKILSKYQISLNKLLSYNYLKGINDCSDNDICSLADQSINGLIKNEVLISDKVPKKQGFFEKFFNFFN